MIERMRLQKWLCQCHRVRPCSADRSWRLPHLGRSLLLTCARCSWRAAPWCPSPRPSTLIAQPAPACSRPAAVLLPTLAAVACSRPHREKPAPAAPLQRRVSAQLCSLAVHSISTRRAACGADRKTQRIDAKMTRVAWAMTDEWGESRQPSLIGCVNSKRSCSKPRRTTVSVGQVRSERSTKARARHTEDARQGTHRVVCSSSQSAAEDDSKFSDCARILFSRFQKTLNDDTGWSWRDNSVLAR